MKVSTEKTIFDYHSNGKKNEFSWKNGEWKYTKWKTRSSSDDDISEVMAVLRVKHGKKMYGRE